VNRRHQVIGGGGQDRAGLNGLACVLPMFPQTGKTERLVIDPVNVVGLLEAVAFLPFVKTGRRNQAASLSEGAAKGRLFRNRFRPGVDQPVADFDLFRPGGDQAPAKKDRRTLTVFDRDDGQNILSWCYVVAGGCLRHVRKAEVCCDLFGGQCQVVAAAHGFGLYRGGLMLWQGVEIKVWQL